LVNYITNSVLQDVKSMKMIVQHLFCKSGQVTHYV